MSNESTGSARPRADAWRRRFIRIVFGVAFGLQIPFLVLLFVGFEQTRFARHAAIGACSLFLLANLPLAARILNWSDTRRATWWRVWLIDTPYFIHFVASILFGPLGIIALAVIAALHLWGHGPRVFGVLAPLYLATITIGTYATLVRRFWTPVRHIRVSVPGLPDDLEGFSLAQLSDVHCGPYLPRAFYRRLARRTSALGTDVIVLTGDMITSGQGYLDDVGDFIAHLSAREGVYASLGNHDYFGATKEVADAMRSGGAEVLQNSGRRIARERAGGVFLAAIDDSWSRRADVELALRDRPAGVPCIVLAHDPDTFPAIAEHAVDLVLAGHTHGGQLGVPLASRRWNLARTRFRFSLGVYKRDSSTLYVHPGNGTTGPPARFGVAPEIAVLTLTRG